MGDVTAKVKLVGKEPQGEGEYAYTMLTFSPDYEDGRNREWAVATPALSLTMNVKPDVAEHFEHGVCYTLVFKREDS